MSRLVSIGRAFFAVALIGLGAEHFVFRDFVTGRAPAWPESVPGGMLWAGLTGATFILIGIAVLSGKLARPAAVVASVLIFGWALLRHVPVLAAEPFLSGAWTQAGKAWTFVGGALAVAATFPKIGVGPALFSRLVDVGSAAFVAGRVCLGLFLVLAGVQHFLFTEFVASLMPAWFPGDAVFWTYFAAVALIAGGIGLLVPWTARLAALLSGLMVFSWFCIIHVPRTFSSVSDGIAVFEALAFSGIALLLAGRENADPPPPGRPGTV
jgi:uncharacterized membrane protein YphA (DoxX/SURF4 family)